MHFEQIRSLYENNLWSNLALVAPFVLSSGYLSHDSGMPGSFSASQRQQVLVMLGDAFVETKDFPRAVDFYKEALLMLKQAKGNKKLLSSCSDEEAKTLVCENATKFKLHLCYTNEPLLNLPMAIDVLKSIPAKMRTAQHNMALGKLYKKLGLDRPAIGCFREVLKVCPLALEASQALMQLQIKGKEIQELTLEATLNNPGMEWHGIWTQAYSAFVNGSDYATAINLFQQLDERSVCRNNPQILSTLGLCQYYSGHYSNAILTLRRVHHLDRSFLPGMDALAALLAKERNVKELQDLATRLLDENKHAAEPWIAMGYYCFLIRKRNRALYFGHKASMINRKNVEALLLKGCVLLDMRKLEDAMNHFQEALVLAPQRYEANSGLVDCYLTQSRHREAVAVSMSALRQLNNSPPALILYARVLTRDPLQMSLSKAKNLCEKALAANAQYLPAVYLMADILDQEKNYDQIISLIRKQLAFQSSSKLHSLLAEALVKCNAEEDALDHFHIALNLDPKNVTAQMGLQKLEQGADGQLDGTAVSAGAECYNELEMDADVHVDAEDFDEEAAAAAGEATGAAGAAADDDDDDYIDVEDSGTEAWSDGDMTST